VKHPTLTACIYPVGVQKAIPAVELSASITSVNSAAFLTTTVSGESVLIDTGMKVLNAPVLADRTRETVVAIYRWNGWYVQKLLFKDTLRGVFGNDGLLEDGLVGDQVVDRFQGSSSGWFIRAQPGNVCYTAIWEGTGFGVIKPDPVATPCPVWN
jgi:hypothetical protein